LLRRIIADLDRHELLETVKWRNGGVKLRQKPQHISLYQILDASWEELGISECSKWNDCENHDHCTTTQLFGQLQTGFNSLLKMYTLDKIIKKS
jgi:Rrf2 family iron-responsive transcriptional regulator